MVAKTGLDTIFLYVSFRKPYTIPPSVNQSINLLDNSVIHKYFECIKAVGQARF